VSKNARLPNLAVTEQDNLHSTARPQKLPAGGFWAEILITLSHIKKKSDSGQQIRIGGSPAR
jgi:hypothetical protein